MSYVGVCVWGGCLCVRGGGGGYKKTCGVGFSILVNGTMLKSLIDYDRACYSLSLYLKSACSRCILKIPKDLLYEFAILSFTHYIL